MSLRGLGAHDEPGAAVPPWALGAATHTRPRGAGIAAHMLVHKGGAPWSGPLVGKVLDPEGPLFTGLGVGGKALHLPSCQPIHMAQVPHQGWALSQGSPAARRSQEDKSGGAEVEPLTFQEGLCFLPQVRVLLTPEKKIYSFNYYSSKKAAGSVGTPAAGKHPPSSQQGAGHPCGYLGGWSRRWWGVSWALAHTGDRPPSGLCSQSHLPAPACPEVGRAEPQDWPPAAKKAGQQGRQLPPAEASWEPTCSCGLGAQEGLEARTWCCAVRGGQRCGGGGLAARPPQACAGRKGRNAPRPRSWPTCSPP